MTRLWARLSASLGSHQWLSFLTHKHAELDARVCGVMVGVCERAWRHVPVNSCVSRGLEVSPSPLARNEAFTPFSFHAVEAAQSVPPHAHAPSVPPKRASPHGAPESAQHVHDAHTRFAIPNARPCARRPTVVRSTGARSLLCLLRPSFLVCFPSIVFFAWYEFLLVLRSADLRL